MSSGPGLVVLAAGASTRLGEPKALARLRPGPGGTALELLLAAGARLGDPRPLVVTGADHAAMASLAREWAEPQRVELSRNPRWAEGRTASVRHAVALRPDRDLCLAPVDVPLVPGEVFEALAEEWRRQGAPERGWLAPWVRAPLRPGGRAFGHPVLIGRALLLDLKELPAARPLRDLRSLARPCLALEVVSARILDDLDLPSDRERLSRHLPGGSWNEFRSP